MCLQEGVQCLSIELDDLPSNFAIFRQAVLRVIDVGLELLHQSYIDVLL